MDYNDLITQIEGFVQDESGTPAPERYWFDQYNEAVALLDKIAEELRARITDSEEMSVCRTCGLLSTTTADHEVLFERRKDGEILGEGWGWVEPNVCFRCRSAMKYILREINKHFRLISRIE